MPLTKVKSKKPRKNAQKRKYSKFASFLALPFFRGISESRHQRIWNQHKILRFFDTHIDIFQVKNFLGHNSTFWILKMQMRKKLYIFKHFAKSKKLFFCQYLSFSVWFPLSLKHWSPLMQGRLLCRRHGGKSCEMEMDIIIKFFADLSTQKNQIISFNLCEFVFWA